MPRPRRAEARRLQRPGQPLRCIFAAERATPAGLPAHEPAISRKRSPSRAAIFCGESARARAAASANGMPSSARQIRSSGPTVASSTPNYPPQHPSVGGRCGFPAAVATPPRKSGGCVVVASSCQEGAGAASAVGQTSAVHGVAGTRVEHPRRGPRGRCVSDHREQLVAWLQDVPPWPGRGLRAGAGATGRATDQPEVRVAGRTDRDRRPSPRRAEHPSNRAAAASGGFDDLT